MRNHTDMISRRDLLKAMEASIISTKPKYIRVAGRLVPVPADTVSNNFHLSTLKK